MPRECSPSVVHQRRETHKEEWEGVVGESGSRAWKSMVS